MSDLIDDYFSRHLGLTRADAVKLHKEYYTSYGLAIEGLVRHHKIDPLEYNDQVDDALPLETVIKPDPEIRQLLEDIDRSKVTVWLFTNAYVTHGRRVVKLLGIEDLFDGLTFCNYAQVPFVCKPQPEAYKKAMAEAGVVKPEHCFFVGEFQLKNKVVSTRKLTPCSRRFRCKLPQRQGLWLDCSSFSGRRYTASPNTGVTVSDTALA